jgi:exosortase D (VPLPA-CTERM-specific)
MMLTPSLSMPRTRAIQTSVLASISVLVALAVFSGALFELVTRWSRQEEYSHGFLIPFVVAWMLWARRDALLASIGRPSWIGPLLILLATIMLIVGELSAFFLLAQLGFIVALIGIVLGIGGYSLFRVSVIPIMFLVFAIPLPYFIDSQLSWRLQLISSELGVFFIRVFQVPVYLTGNVIDLGNYKLQVVEACSGLRYLYPLLSLGFLAAYLFQAPFWQRALVFLSTIPITILMNSLRIALVGVMVDRWGVEMAEGLLHFFEGWVIFLACAALLAAEIYLLARIGSGKSFFQVFYLPKVSPSVSRRPQIGSIGRLPVAACLVLLCAAGLAVFFVSSRNEIVPERLRFVAFPDTLGQWHGRPSSLEPQIEHVLGLEDYILSDYNKPKDGAVNLYVAYYASQRKGSSPHSPIVCLPGGGWQIINFERISYSNDALRLTLPLNRAVIAQNSDKLLVYYWFVQRGRRIANEYWSKWYLFADSITKNRTDGALVRLTTPIYPGESEQKADERLQSFIQELEPRLSAYLPAETASDVKSVLHRPRGGQS